MAQEDYTEEDLFSISETDIKDLDTAFAFSDTDAGELVAATEQDKKEAKETGKAKVGKQPEKEEEEEVRSELDEEPVAKKEKKDPGDKQPEEEPLSELGEFAKGFFKAGIWNRDEDEDPESFPDSEEDFLERADYESRKKANNYITQVATRHGDDAAELFDAVYKNGVPVKEFVNKWQESQDFKAMDMTDEGNQERVIRTFLEQQQIAPDKIADKIKKLKLAEDLEEEANTYHAALVKKQDADLVRIQQDASRKLEQKKAADIQYSTIIRTILADKAKAQDFDGIPVNTKTASKAQDFLETKKWKLNDGTLITDFDRMVMELKNLANLEALVKIALLTDYQPGKPIALNLESVEKRKDSKAATDKFFNLKNGKNPAKLVPSETKEPVNLLADL